MIATTPQIQNVRFDHQIHIFRSQIAVGVNSVQAVLALHSAQSGVQCPNVAKIGDEILNETLLTLCTLEAGYATDWLRQALVQVLSQDFSNSQPDVHFTMVISLGPYIAIGSSEPFEAVRWNGSRLDQLHVRKPTDISLHVLSVRTSPEYALIAAVPSGHLSELTKSLSQHDLYEPFQRQPDDCLAEIAISLSSHGDSSDKLLLGYSGTSDGHVSAARVPRDNAYDSGDGNTASQLADLTREMQAVRHAVGELPQKLPVDTRPFNILVDRLRECEERSVEKTVIEPLVNQLILLADLLPAPAASEDTPAVRAIRESLHNTLSIYGVTPIALPKGKFDAHQQRCVGDFPTSNRLDKGLVAERVRAGYRRDGRVIRHEEVRVFRLVDGN